MEKEKKDFVLQLETYASQGVPILLEGCVSTPQEIAEACFLREEAAYMCDFIFCENNERLQELHFDKIKKN